MNRFLIALCATLTLVATSLTVVRAQPNLTGKWEIEQSGNNGTTSSVVNLKQSGNGIVGNSPTTTNGFTGEFVSDTQINGKWHGPGGAGWLTIYVSPNGHSFNGTWGYNGTQSQTARLWVTKCCRRRRSPRRESGTLPVRVVRRTLAVR